MKKRVSIFLMSVISTILLLPSILAQFNRGQPFNTANIAQFINDVIFNIIIFARPIFIIVLGQYESNDLFFSKILLFFLLFVILRKAIEKTPFGEDNEKIGLIVSLIVSILGIRFIGQNGFLASIFIQYGVLTIAATVIIPMVIFFYFINMTKVGTFGKKMFWGLYAIIMSGIWISQQGRIPPEANYIYLASIAAAILFIVFDKSIQTYFGISGFHKFARELNEETIRDLRRRLADYSEDHSRGIMTASEYDTLKKKILKKVKRLSTH